MDLERIEQDFRNKVCEKLEISSEGIERFRVFTPFMFEDGDHLSVVLKRDNGQVDSVRRGPYLYASDL